MSLREVLRDRDGMSPDEIDEIISDFKADLEKAISRGDLEEAEELVQTYFGLEPDYLEEFLF